MHLVEHQVGTYNPLATRSGVKEVTFKVDRIRYWISVGAQPSDRVAWLLGQVRPRTNAPDEPFTSLFWTIVEGGRGRMLICLFGSTLLVAKVFGGTPVVRVAL